MTETLQTTSTSQPTPAPTDAPATLEQAAPALTTRAPLVDRASRRLAAGRDWTRGRTLEARRRIQAHPMRTAALAMGAGLLTGLMMKGLSRR